MSRARTTRRVDKRKATRESEKGTLHQAAQLIGIQTIRLKGPLDPLTTMLIRIGFRARGWGHFERKQQAFLESTDPPVRAPMYMRARQEIEQGAQGLALHFFEAFGLVLAWHLLGQELFVANLAILGFSVFWELGMHLLTRPGWPLRRLAGRTWLASVFGMVAFWLGGATADVIVIFGGQPPQL